MKIVHDSSGDSLMGVGSGIDSSAGTAAAAVSGALIGADDLSSISGEEHEVEGSSAGDSSIG